MKFLKIGIIAVAFLLPVLAPAQVNDDSVRVGVKVTIQQVFDVALIAVYDYDPSASGNAIPSSDDTVDYFNRTPGTYTVGSTNGTYAVDVQVSNNTGSTYYLKLRGTGDFTSGTNTFALSNLKWALDGDPGSQTWTDFTTTYTQIGTGGNEQKDYYIDYRLVVPWSASAASNYKTETRYLLTTTP
uniref:Uncharacterized protein n=1 Tax=candidate division WOR-3 bacterium TaxID=2052148 RepID=A0A7C4XLV7_UNCW3